MDDIFVRCTAILPRPQTFLLLFLGANILYALRRLHQHAGHLPIYIKNLTETSPQIQPSRMCELYPDPGNIAVSVKTGATEAVAKLPWILNTSLSCVRNIMIFSDLQQTIAGHQVHDVLSKISPSIRDNSSDLDLYREQQSLRSRGRESEIPLLANVLAPKHPDGAKGTTTSWTLDKYKFLPMLEMAHELQPERDWYVFVEADTYLSWPKLLRWLATLDPRRKALYGDPVELHKDREPFFFANGGAGYVLSGTALKEYAGRDAASRWNGLVHRWNGGDMVLADVLYEEIGLKMTSVKPMLNKRSPEEMRFGEDFWCQPLISLHHMEAQDLQAIYRYEQSSNFSKLQLRDVFDVFHRSGGLPLRRENWDNMSEDRAFRIALKEDVEAVSPHTD